MRSEARRKLQEFGDLELEMQEAAEEGNPLRVISLREEIYKETSLLRVELEASYETVEDLDIKWKIQQEIDDCKLWQEDYDPFSKHYKRTIKKAKNRFYTDQPLI